MDNKKTLKTVLLSSVIVLILCFVTLLSTTFAWFTDSVTSGTNVIKTGKLDILVEYTLDGENWANLEDADDLFQQGLWEPGHTEVVVLKVTNAGNLALKYAATMDINEETVGKTKTGEDIVLSQILTVRTFVNTENAVEAAFAAKNGVAYGEPNSFMAGNVLGETQLLKSGDSEYVYIQVGMAETVGNEANHDGVHAPSIDFGVNIVATQCANEEDTFGTLYDVNAQYPGKKRVSTEAQFLAAIAEGGSIQLIADIELTGAETVISTDAVIDLNNYSLTGNSSYTDGNAATSAILTVSGAEVTIKGGLVENEEITDGANFALLVDDGGKLIIKDGTYVADDSAVYVNNGELVIEGGFFEAHKSTSPDPDYKRVWQGVTYTNYLAAVINCAKSAYNNYIYEATGNVAKANVDVYGGTFVNEDPSLLMEGDFIDESHVMEGYKVVKEMQTNGDAWYVVIPE